MGPVPLRRHHTLGRGPPSRARSGGRAVRALAAHRGADGRRRARTRSRRRRECGAVLRRCCGRRGRHVHGGRRADVPTLRVPPRCQLGWGRRAGRVVPDTDGRRILVARMAAVGESTRLDRRAASAHGIEVARVRSDCRLHRAHRAPRSAHRWSARRSVELLRHRRTGRPRRGSSCSGWPRPSSAWPCSAGVTWRLPSHSTVRGYPPVWSTSCC